MFYLWKNRYLSLCTPAERKKYLDRQSASSKNNLFERGEKECKSLFANPGNLVRNSDLIAGLILQGRRFAGNWFRRHTIGQQVYFGPHFLPAVSSGRFKEFLFIGCGCKFNEFSVPFAEVISMNNLNRQGICLTLWKKTDQFDYVSARVWTMHSRLCPFHFVLINSTKFGILMVNVKLSAKSKVVSKLGKRVG